MAIIKRPKHPQKPSTTRYIEPLPLFENNTDGPKKTTHLHPQKLLKGVKPTKTRILEKIKTIQPVFEASETPVQDSTQIVETPQIPSPQVQTHLNNEWAQTYRKSEKQKVQEELDQFRKQSLENLEVEKARILQSAHDEGYQKGLEEGQNKLNSEVENLLKAIQSLNEEKQNILAAAKPELLKLSLDIAQRLILFQFNENPDDFIPVIEEALTRITDKDKVIIRVNPDQVDVVRRHKDSILERINDIKNLEIQDDPKITFGGCIIETKLGFVDASVTIKLEHIQKALFDAFTEPDENHELF